MAQKIRQWDLDDLNGNWAGIQVQLPPGRWGFRSPTVRDTSSSTGQTATTTSGPTDCIGSPRGTSWRWARAPCCCSNAATRVGATPSCWTGGAARSAGWIRGYSPTGTRTADGPRPTAGGRLCRSLALGATSSHSSTYRRAGKFGTLDLGVMDPSAMAWSPDSNWLFVVTHQGSIAAIDPESGRSRPLGLGSHFSQLAVRR